MEGRKVVWAGADGLSHAKWQMILQGTENNPNPRCSRNLGSFVKIGNMFFGDVYRAKGSIVPYKAHISCHMSSYKHPEEA